MEGSHSYFVLCDPFCHFHYQKVKRTDRLWLFHGLTHRHIQWLDLVFCMDSEWNCIWLPISFLVANVNCSHCQNSAAQMLKLVEGKLPAFCVGYSTCTHIHIQYIYTKKSPSQFSVVRLETLTRILFTLHAFQSSGEIWCAVTLNIQSNMVAKAGHCVCVHVCVCWFIPPYASGGSQTRHEIVCQQLGPVSPLLLLSLNLKSAFILHKHKQVVTQTVL